MFWKWLYENHPVVYETIEWAVLFIALLAVLHS